MKSLHYIAALFLLCSCTEEIQLDYRPIDPLYVIEGHVSNEGSEVVITGTRDIDDQVLKTGPNTRSRRASTFSYGTHHRDGGTTLSRVRSIECRVLSRARRR